VYVWGWVNTFTKNARPVNVCVREKDRERERACVCVCERERESTMNYARV